MCRYTSPYGNESANERNHAAPTSTVFVSRYATTATAPNAATRYRRATSRSENGTKSRMAAPTYPPGVEASASGHAAQMPVAEIGTSSVVARARATVPTIAPYPSDRLDLSRTAKCGTRIARFASGRNRRNASDHPAADPARSVPRRTSRIARATT